MWWALAALAFLGAGVLDGVGWQPVRSAAALAAGAFLATAAG